MFRYDVDTTVGIIVLVIASVPLVIFLWDIVGKYRVMLGGKRVDAVLVRHEFCHTRSKYREIFSFEHEGQTIHMGRGTTTNNPLPIGSRPRAYYSPKHPHIVVFNPKQDLLRLGLGLAFLFMAFRALI